MAVPPEISSPANAPAAVASRRQGEPFIVAAMAMIVAVCYGASAWNNQFVFDDHTVIETLPGKLTPHDFRNSSASRII